MEILSVERLCLVVGIALLPKLAHTAYCLLRNPTWRVPGPWYSKWTELILTYYWLTGHRAQYVHSLHERYGPIVRIGPNEVDVADMDAVRSIYTTKETFRKAPWYDHFVYDVDNLFSTRDVEFHRRHRRLLAAPLAESSMLAFSEQIVGRVKLAIDKIRQDMKTKGAADVFKWWYFMATDVIGELTFGDSFRMLELGRKNEYARHLETIMYFGAIQSTFPVLISLARTFPLPFLNEVAKSGARVKRYAVESLDRFKSLLDSDSTRVPQTLFTNLFKAEGDETITYEEIQNEAELYIVAGSDTTANTLTFLVWSICQRPEIRSALVKELSTLPEDFGASELKELPYLNQVISEGLRLYPVVPTGLPRVVPPGGADIGGYYLNEGTTVCAQAYTLHRDLDAFPSPEAFMPSRWASPSKQMKDAYMPFGRGPRICIGMHLAMLELRAATARFFRAFPDAEVSTLEGMSDRDMQEENHFVLSPKGKRCLIQAASVAAA